MLLLIQVHLLLAYCTLIAATPTSREKITIRVPEESPTSHENDDVTAQYKMYGFVGCSNDEKNEIYAAFKEKDQIVGISDVRDINWSSAAVVDYFGPPSHIQASRRLLQANFQGIYGFGNGWWFNSRNTQIFCHDRAIVGDRKEDCNRGPGHIVTVNRYADDHDAMMFCTSWFALKDLEHAKLSGLVSSQPFDISNYDNRALYVISALCMKHDVCPWPSRNGNGVPALGHLQANFPDAGRHFLSTPSAIKFYNKSRATFKRVYTLANVDTYAWFAMALYIQQGDNLGHYPVIPSVPEQLNFDGWVTNDSNDNLELEVDLRPVLGSSRL